VTKIISASQSNKVAKKKDKESQCNGVIKKDEPIKLEYYISKINELKKLSIKNNRIYNKINDKINNKYNKNNKKYYLKEFLLEEDEYYSSDTDEYYSDDSNY
jgi:ATP-dependent Lon protease